MNSRQESLGRFRKAFPYPEVDPSIEPYLWRLDLNSREHLDFDTVTNGKELVIERIVDNDAKLLLEIGSFLGGSAYMWLKASPDITVICIDPWGDSWAGDYAAAHGDPRFKDQLNAPEGFYRTFIRNLAPYRPRVIPVRGRSPAVLLDVFLAGVEPDIVYVDAAKTFDDIAVSRQLWPSAILCGDDWGYAVEGTFPARDNVTKFANMHGYRIVQAQETWVLEK